MSSRAVAVAAGLAVGAGIFILLRKKAAAAAAAAAAPPMAALLHTCKAACEEMLPFIEAVYATLGKDPTQSVRKEDKSHFSLADGVVQAMLTRLLAGHINGVLGEEDASSIEIGTPPFRAGHVTAPADLEPIIVAVRAKMDALAQALPKHDAYKSLLAVIDPIDGSKEFCTGLGEQCSICIGFADVESGMAVAGLVYRPLCSIKSYALGCKSEGLAESRLRQYEPLAGGEFLATGGGVSGFVTALAEEMGATMRRTGCAGNKALRVLEEANGCYIQDRGLKRWDTCAAQAAIEAHGGCFVQLHPLAAASPDEPPPLVRYQYRKGGVNTDFVPGVINLKKYNVAPGVELPKSKDEPPPKATSPDQLNAYSNALGAVALPKADAASVEAVRAAILRAAARKAPAFD